MKKKTKTQNKRGSYRLLGTLTFFLVLTSALLGFFVSEDACLASLFGGVTLITFGAIFSFTVVCAAEIEREKNEAEKVASVSGKIPKRS